MSLKETEGFRIEQKKMLIWIEIATEASAHPTRDLELGWPFRESRMTRSPKF